MQTDRYNDCPQHHINIPKDCNGVVPDCHAVTQNSSGSSPVMSPALVLVETTNESVCGGTVVSTKMKGLLSPVTRPEGLLSPNLHPYCTICRNCVSPLGTSTTPCRDVWHVGRVYVMAMATSVCVCGLLAGLDFFAGFDLLLWTTVDSPPASVSELRNPTTDAYTKQQLKAPNTECMRTVNRVVQPAETHQLMTFTIITSVTLTPPQTGLSCKEKLTAAPAVNSSNSSAYLEKEVKDLDLMCRSEEEKDRRTDPPACAVMSNVFMLSAACGKVEKPVKSLGKVFDCTLKDPEAALQATGKELGCWLTAVDKSGLPGKFKAWMYQHGLLPRPLWPLLVYDVPVTTVKGFEKKVTQYLRRWLGLPRSLSNIGLYGRKTKLQLPFNSLTEEFEAIRAREVLLYRLN
ncbi:hypothetical protein NFI96_019371 [Prochilodus magdalenae]|nr:hypothetical protein NFI96_019371 [Prochilodus magdalenae]